MPQRFEQSQTAIESPEMNDLIRRLSPVTPESGSAATIQAVAEATGLHPDHVRAELDLMRMERRVSELEKAVSAPSYAGSASNLESILRFIRDPGPAVRTFIVLLGVAFVLIAGAFVSKAEHSSAANIPQFAAPVAPSSGQPR